MKLIYARKTRKTAARAGIISRRASQELLVAKGRKETFGRLMQHRTSKDSLRQFGLNDLSELPSFEDLVQ